MIADLNTGEPTVVLQRRLEVIGGRAIAVPGCEPTTSTSSTTLMRELRAVCKNSMVDVQAALLAIPGSTLEFGINFVNKIAKIAQSEGHHPDILVGWRRVTVHLTTHAIGGLSENDFIVAAKIDAL